MKEESRSVKGSEEELVEGSVKDSWMGGREGETEGNWRKPEEKKMRKKVKASMMVIVIVLMGLGGTTSMLLEEEATTTLGGVWFLCQFFRERESEHWNNEVRNER